MKNKNFWNNFKKPFFVMAPMADVTDTAFRQIIAKYGKPDVFFTEFVSCDGLSSKGRDVLLHDLKYSESERPIVAQIFGGNQENFYECAKLISELGFDGIDINMGCPDRSVEKQGAGAALIKDPKRAREIIREIKRGSGGLPVSVKTRTGYNKSELDSWISEILVEEPTAITIHARTRKEMSKVPAKWEDVASVVKIRDEMKVKTLVIGNGDVKDLDEAKDRVKETGVDGVMIGRGIYGNPWLFNKKIDREDVPLPERLRVMVEHTRLFESLHGDKKNFAIMKKHYKAYATGFDGAKELRMNLMEAKNATEVGEIVEEFLK